MFFATIVVRSCNWPECGTGALTREARSKWGETSELRLLLDSWRDSLDDEETLQALRSFTRSGRYFRKIVGMAEDLPTAGDAREFIVVPPNGGAFDDIQMHARIEEGWPQATVSGVYLARDHRGAIPQHLSSAEPTHVVDCCDSRPPI